MRAGHSGTFVRWLFPAVLAMALLGMHHLPASGDPAPETHVRAVLSATTSPPGGVQHQDHEPAGHPFLAPEPADGHPAGHELLHLCLAVLTAVVGVVLAFFVVVRGLGERLSGAGPPAIAAVSAGARPPPPLARRLAALGVLRL